MSREAFEKKIAERLPPEKFHQIMFAYRLSKYGHRNQKRANGEERYFEHPKRTALILLDELSITDADMIITALLHDIVEDSFLLTPRDIEHNFGERVRKIVECLTKDHSLKKRSKDKRYRRQLAAADDATKIVKLADRLDNLRDMKGWTPQKKRAYKRETIRDILPLVKGSENPHLACLADKIKTLIS